MNEHGSNTELSVDKNGKLILNAEQQLRLKSLEIAALFYSGRPGTYDSYLISLARNVESHIKTGERRER